MVGLGNALSAYSYYYLISKYNKQNFDFENDMKSVSWQKKGLEILKLMKHDMLLKLLPLNDEYTNNFSIDPSIAITETGDFCGLFYHMKMYGILENVSILRPLILKAIDKFSPLNFVFHQDDVVIHVRTGDIFSNKHEAFYSSIHFRNYLTLLEGRAINKIYIVWKSDRKQDKAYDTYSKVIVTHLKKFLCENLHLPNECVVLERQHIDDFVFMVRAPLLIACISTYSMWAALLNTKASIIPQCKNHFNNRLYEGDYFRIINMKTVNKYKKNIGEFCNQFTM